MSGNISNLLELPEEILVKILRCLNYEEIPKARLTCTRLNETGRYVQCAALRSLRRKMSGAMRKLLGSQDGRRRQPLDTKRMAKGAGSLFRLACLVEGTDAETYHLVKCGVLPPLPAAVFRDLDKAVTMATWRNPLVGHERLLRLAYQIEEYWRNATMRYADPRGDWPPLDETALLHTILDTIDILPHRMIKINTIEEGLRVDCWSLWSQCGEFLSVPFLFRVDVRETLKHVIAEGSAFKTYIMHHLFRYLPTCNGKYIEIPSHSLERTIEEMNYLSLFIRCDPRSVVGLVSLDYLKQVHIQDFRLVLRSEETQRMKLRRSTQEVLLASSSEFKFK